MFEKLEHLTQTVDTTGVDALKEAQLPAAGTPAGRAAIGLAGRTIGGHTLAWPMLAVRRVFWPDERRLA